MVRHGAEDPTEGGRGERLFQEWIDDLLFGAGVYGSG